MVEPHTISAPPTLARRFALRFLVAYVVLYCFPAPLSELPGIGGLFGWVDDAWNVAITWFGARVFGLTITHEPSGSGDTLWSWVQVPLLVLLAFVCALVWTLATRRARDDAALVAARQRKLSDQLRMYVRVVLGTVLIGYGVSKVVPMQFPAPEPEMLFLSYAESSPMGLLWRFMGASPAYTVFAGSCETLAGVLLFFRRTATIGALIGLAVLTNVVMLNLCYDVPVKLYSMQLAALCVVLLAPDARRLLDVLLLQRATPAVELARPWRWTLAERARPWIKVAFLLWILGVGVWTSVSTRTRWLALSTPLQGVYVVDAFERAPAAEMTVAARVPAWDWWSISRRGHSVVHMLGQGTTFFGCEVDETARTITWQADSSQAPAPLVWSYELDGETAIVLRGEYSGAPTTVRAHRVDMAACKLQARGFHWVNEYPYNR